MIEGYKDITSTYQNGMTPTRFWMHEDLTPFAV
jgi:hypothetical protein